MGYENYSAEGGVEGASVVNGNQGASSGTALTMAIGAGVSVKFGAAAAAHGGMGLIFTRTATGSKTFGQRAVTPSARGADRVYFQAVGSVPTGTVNFLNPLDSAGASIAQVGISSAGKLMVQNAAGTTIWTAAAAIAADTWYRIDFGIEPGATTTTGKFQIAYGLYDSPTNIESGSGTTANFGTVQSVGYWQYGRTDNTGWIGTTYMDDMASNDLLTGTALIGPISSPSPSARPVSVISNAGAFTNVGGAASLQAALADESDSTYIQSPDNPTAAVIEVGVNELGSGPITAKFVISADLTSPAGSLTLTVRQGTTVISTRTVTPVSTTPSTYQWDLSTGEVAAVTDRTALRLYISASV